MSIDGLQAELLTLVQIRRNGYCTSYISCCHVYISAFYGPILAIGITRGLLPRMRCFGWKESAIYCPRYAHFCQCCTNIIPCISWLHRYAKVDPLYVPTHQDRIVPRKNTYQIKVVVGSFVRCAQTDVSVGSSENGRKR